MVVGPVLIVGAGVFGLSTALELVKKGHFVYVLDKHPPPSPWSAACDFNKIIRCEYADPIYAEMAIEALHFWRSDPLFKQSYDECGRLLVTPKEHRGRIEFERKGIEVLKTLGEGNRFCFFSGGAEISRLIPGFENNSIPPEQEVKYNPDCGLGRSHQTLKDVYKYLSSHPNVQFIFGEKGAAVGLKRYRSGEVGVITESGFVHSAGTVILSLGANTAKIVNLENQQSATGLFVTHIQLSDEEYTKYRDIPVLFDAEMGYFFPPDLTTKIMKICLTGCGIKRSVTDPFDSRKQISLPRFHIENPSDTFPKELVQDIQRLLEKYVPELKEHRLFGSMICWIGDTKDTPFLIDKVPYYKNLYVATGDSGHGYKFFPNIGKYIVQKLDGVLANKIEELWKWTPRTNEECEDPANSKWRVSKGKSKDITEIDFITEVEVPKL